MTTPAKTPCRRDACGAQTVDGAVYCSDLCLTIARATAYPTSREYHATMGRSAVVAQVGPLSWLDVRAEAVAG